MDDLFGFPEPPPEQQLERRVRELELQVSKANQAVVDLIDICSGQYREITRLRRKAGEPVATGHMPPKWYREKDWRERRK